jgi:hypothetical protein
MAFREVSDLSADTTISLGGTNRKTGKVNPTSIEGYYLGSRQIADAKKKSGISYIHIFQTSKGNVGVWGKTDLDSKIKSVTPGTMVRASFDKMVKTPNGEMYKYKVQFDDANTIEVTAQDESLEASPEQETDASSYKETVYGEEDSTDAEEAALLLAVEQAERQAKVKAMLAKAKNKNQ